MKQTKSLKIVWRGAKKALPLSLEASIFAVSNKNH